MSEIEIDVELRVMLREMVDQFGALGAPEQDVADARQHADGLMEALGRLHDWREQRGLPKPRIHMP